MECYLFIYLFIYLDIRHPKLHGYSCQGEYEMADTTMVRIRIMIGKVGDMDTVFGMLLFRDMFRISPGS